MALTKTSLKHPSVRRTLRIKMAEAREAFHRAVRYNRSGDPLYRNFNVSELEGISGFGLGKQTMIVRYSPARKFQVVWLHPNRDCMSKDISDWVFHRDLQTNAH